LEAGMNRGLIGAIIGFLVNIILVIVIMRMV
jgi:tetrahydromethanopterin S-methyltransferase subunit F